MSESSASTERVFSLEDVVIRPARKNDLPALEWDGEFRHFRLVYANAYDRMVKGTSMIWIAELPIEGLIGQVFLQLVSDRPELSDGWQRAYLYSFRIKPLYQNNGLGTQMVKVVEDYLLSKHFTRITLNVAKDNLGAIRLYQRLDYHIVAEEPGVWSYPDDEGKWHTVIEPSWRMEKELGKKNQP
jgi:ribosomal protein S18 acetylase RimI-like enzyme